MGAFSERTYPLSVSGNDVRYRYAHDEPDAYAAGEDYLPQGDAAPELVPSLRPGAGREDQEKLERLRELDRKAKDNTKT